MKKQKIQLLILLLALVALGGTFFGVKKYNELQENRPAEEEEQTIIVNVAESDMIRLSYDYAGKTYCLEKKDGVWHPAEDSSRKVKDYYVDLLAKGMAPLTATQTLENVTDLAQYGLEKPLRTIILETAVQRFQINVGDNNSLTGGCYIQVTDRPETVYIVPQAYAERYNYALDDILEAVEEAEQPEETEPPALQNN